MCPYFDSEYNRCVLYETYQDGYQKEGYCLSSDKWKGTGKTANFWGNAKGE